MGNAASTEDVYTGEGGQQGPARTTGVTEARQPKKSTKLPPGAVKSKEEDWEYIKQRLANLLLFNDLDPALQRQVVSSMYERSIPAGDILIKEGDSGAAAAELYVVKSGEFEVLQKRQGVNFRVNMKHKGDIFGEVALLYNSPRNATVAATQDSVVWVLERDMFRAHIRETQQAEDKQVEVFMNSVPILQNLTVNEKIRLSGAFQQKAFQPGSKVINQGDRGDLFYLIKEGEASVYESSAEGQKKVNHLFKSDYFGERALLSDEPRTATVEAAGPSPLVCLTLDRKTFREILGPLEEIMKRDKSEEITVTKLMKLAGQGHPPHIPADVLIKRKVRASDGSEAGWDIVRSRGHLDEVLELKQVLTSKEAEAAAANGGAASSTGGEDGDGKNTLVLMESHVLGGGAFSKVSQVAEETSGRQYALKRMRKIGVVQCPDHVFCEQTITKQMAFPFCIRQYASFQDKYNLYFLFDLMNGGDLMDVLVAEAKVIRKRVPQGSWRRACLAPKVKMLMGMEEDLARFYVACITLALEYLHNNNTVYRDLKPENVLVDQGGYVKLGDFGFAKVLPEGGRTYTFCGTPGYVAPENVLAHGYNYSVDWWGMGVLMYVLLTGRQPFSSPKTDDPMVVMRRIVDENWPVKYPPYLSPEAKDLIGRLLERKPAKRLGMLSGRASDIKHHKWFAGFDWNALEARKMTPPRKGRDDSNKRLKELADDDRKHKNDPKETPEELAECEQVFADF